MNKNIFFGLLFIFIALVVGFLIFIFTIDESNNSYNLIKQISISILLLFGGLLTGYLVCSKNNKCNCKDNNCTCGGSDTNSANDQDKFKDIIDKHFDIFIMISFLIFDTSKYTTEQFRDYFNFINDNAKYDLENTDLIYKKPENTDENTTYNNNLYKEYSALQNNIYRFGLYEIKNILNIKQNEWKLINTFIVNLFPLYDKYKNTDNKFINTKELIVDLSKKINEIADQNMKNKFIDNFKSNFSNFLNKPEFTPRNDQKDGIIKSINIIDNNGLNIFELIKEITNKSIYIITNNDVNKFEEFIVSYSAIHYNLKKHQYCC